MRATDHCQPLFVPREASGSPDEAVRWCERLLGEAPRVIDRPGAWEADLRSLPADILADLPVEPVWEWVLLPWIGAVIRIPEEAVFWAIVTSRNYPIISRREQSALRAASVVVVGLSVGRSVAQQLARIGVGHLVLADADTVAASNLNRMIGSGVHEVGVAKTVSLARELAQLNPYLRVHPHTDFVDAAGLEAIVGHRRPDVIVEMIDNVAAKVEVREVARRHGIPVVMATDMDWDPFIDIEMPQAPIFNGRLAPPEVEQLRDPAVDFATKTRLVMKFMALDAWAPRSLLSGTLARAGLISYWSQTAPSAVTAGALVSRAVLDLVRGRTDMPERVAASLRGPFGAPDEIEHGEPLVMRLAEAHGALSAEEPQPRPGLQT